jgi:hypothetical protein
MFSMGGSSAPTNSFNLSELKGDIFCTEINFLTAGRSDQPVATYNFLSPLAAQVWDDAVARRGDDPLLYFVASLPHIFEFADSAPAVVIQQLVDLLGAPDMDFLHGFLKTAASQKPEVAKEAVLTVLSLIQEAGLLAPWFRAVFNIEINLLESTDTIFQESSAASISSSVFLGILGNEFANEVAGILLRNVNSLDAGIRQIVEAVDKVPPALRLVFGTCFRATRRKYKERLLPILAVSRFLTERFLLGEFAVISPDLREIGGKLASVFAFKKLPDDGLGDDIPKLVGDFLLEISTMVWATVQLPQGDNLKVLQFCAENATLLTEKIEETKIEDEHPLHWSILELLETRLFGDKEDYGDLLKGKSYVL